MASQVDDRAQQARAYNGLARAYFALGDPGRARHNWQQALARYTAIGTPEANEIRTRQDWRRRRR